MQKKEEQNNALETLDTYLSPSFNSYSTDQLARIAEEQVGRVPYRAQNDVTFTPLKNDDSDFEFAAFREANYYDDRASFDDDVFPLFNRALLRENRGSDGRRRKTDPPPPSSESSSEAYDLDGVPAKSYCVWLPNSPQASPCRCKKSKSTGSSSKKRWKLLDLLRRSNSEGKESFVFLTAPPSSRKNKAKEANVAGKPKAEQFPGGAGEKKKVSASAHEALYGRKGELGRGDKRRTFLPYRQDLVLFWGKGVLGKI